VARSVSVLGAGAWGTALASVLARNGHAVTMWAREPEVVESVNRRSENELFLEGIALPDSLRATGSLEEAVSGAGVIVSVVPAQYVRSVWSGLAERVGADALAHTLVVSASKGIETTTLERMDQVLGEILPAGARERFTVLSGPSFALEVAQELPTLVVSASHLSDAAEEVQTLFQNRSFRVYTSSDVVGVELGGALKNVIAVAAGAAAGLGFGHNTMAALITRGLAEMTRLGVAMGARRETFAGLAGMGDLVLTCTGELSRNRTVGFRLGQGEALDDILGPMRTVAEGVKTVQAVHALARRHGVEMPIAAEVHAMLTEGRAPLTALDNLMRRPPTTEEWT
jgi:glycerol-3-phosphate dehydrogenase (NAD(P)+)